MPKLKQGQEGRKSLQEGQKDMEKATHSLLPQEKGAMMLIHVEARL